MASVTTDQLLGVNASQAIKVPCDMASTTNITLSGEQTIDGQTSSSSRVLVTGQTDATENGIYDSNTGAWTRAPDWDGANDVVTGTLVRVHSGTSNSGTWKVTTTGTITPGTTSVALTLTDVDAEVRADLASTATDDGTKGFHLVYYPLTTAESSAGITPTNYEYPDGNVLRYGADKTGATDSTSAFRAACLSDDTSYVSGSNLDSDTQDFIRLVHIPAGVYRIDDTVCVRKGTHFKGDGAGSTHLIFVNGTPTQGSIILGGTDESGSFVGDPGGIPPKISDMFMTGGQPAIEARAAGCYIENIFFNAPATNGISLNTSDTIVSNCIFDLGSTHIGIQNSGNLITECVFYRGTTNIRFSVDDSTTNIISNCTFEFATDRMISFEALRCYNNKIQGCTFFTTTQSWVTVGAIVLDSNSTHVDINDCKFRNLPQFSIKHISGSSITARVANCTFDARTNENGQPTTTAMQGIKVDGGGIDMRVENCEFYGLNGQPITFDDNLGSTSHLVLKGCRFDGTTGGSGDIDVQASNFSSLLEIYDTDGSGRDLFIYDATANCDIKMHNVNDWFDAAVDDATDWVYTIPFVGPTVYEYALYANTNPGASGRNRQIETGHIAVEIGDISTVLSTKITKTQIHLGSGFDESAISSTAEMTSKGTGASVSIIDRGNWVLSFSNGYDDLYLHLNPLHRSKKDT